MRTLLFTIFMLVSGWINAQYPTGYFRSPVDIPIYLAGSFAELRGNHFHSGIDIKTQGTEGKNIYAIADGHVSRIKISPYGFGKAIYIAHPNGYTSVYAHLSEFKDPMASYFEEMQYLKESYALDLYLTPGQMKVKKGDVIALSGNSGSSSGPHLHFEIRHSASQKPINPQFFGFDITDTRQPVAWWLYTYSRNGSKSGPVAHKLATVKNGLRLQDRDNTLLLPAGGVAFSLKALDRMNGSGNRLGVHMLKLTVDDKEVYQFKTDQFSFAETRYLNAHIDYYLQEERGTRVHRLHRLPGDKLSMYENIVNNGWIQLEEGETKKVKVALTDVSGNRNELNFKVKGVAPPGKQTTLSGGKMMVPNRSNSFSEGNFSISLPSTALYDTIRFQFGTQEGGKLEKCFSPIYHIHDEATPLHSRSTVKISAPGYPVVWKQKTVARRGGKAGDYDYYEGSWQGNTFVFKTREFGPYHLSADTMAPVVEPKNFYNGQTLKPGQRITLTIKDEESGINNYDVYLDGKWLLMAYDFKRDVLMGTLPFDLDAGEHLLQAEVSDDVDNNSLKTFKINIQP